MAGCTIFYLFHCSCPHHPHHFSSISNLEKAESLSSYQVWFIAPWLHSNFGLRSMKRSYDGISAQELSVHWTNKAGPANTIIRAR